MVSPVVSIVMPTYNRAALLPFSIVSILSQDFKNLELIIVDDGSTDETAAVVKEIKKRDPRIRYQRLLNNKGIGFARETGLRYVSAEYIGFADSDDLWLPGKLKAQVQILDEYPEIDFLFGDFWNVDHLKGLESRAFIMMQAGLEHLVTSDLGGDLIVVEGGVEFGLLKKTFIQLGTTLFRGSLLAKIGSFNKKLSGSEDFEFCWRAAALGAKFAYLDKPLVKRHKILSSFTANPVKSWLGVLDALLYCRKTCILMNRMDLLEHIHDAEKRAWRNIISTYVRLGRRWLAVSAYLDSLKTGLSLRTLAFFILMLIGPNFFDRVNQARIRFRRLGWKPNDE